MKILMINGSDTKGGAGRVGYQLATDLIKRNHQVEMLTEEKHSDHDWVQAVPPKEVKHTKKWKTLHSLGLNSLQLHSNFPKTIEPSLLERFDILHLHDPKSFNLSQLPYLSKFAPVVWTLHSMAPFTGNCIYSYDCDRYKRNCGKCPLIKEFPLNYLNRDASRYIVGAKHRSYKKSRLYPVGVSQWISDRARESKALGNHRIETVRNGINIEDFPKRDTIECKTQLGINPEKNTILISFASNSQDNRKGFDVALKALAKLKDKKITVIPLGITQGIPEWSSTLADLGAEFLEFKHLSTPEELSLHYGAADIVWHPSRADTSSLVSMEAMATGTPVIASRVGGVPEVVIEGVGGHLIPSEDHQALATITEELFDNSDKIKTLSQTACDYARTHHNSSRMTQDYEEFYEGVKQDFQNKPRFISS